MANLIAKAAIGSGMYAQAFPEFGPERRGAPVKAYARFSTEPIMTRSEIEKPDFIIVMDKSLLNLEATQKGVSDKTKFLVQTNLPAESLKKEYNFLPDHHHIYCIDSTGIIAEYQNQVHLSIPMVGKFLHVTELVPLDTVIDELKKEFLEKIGEEKTKLAEKALEESYYQV